ncbi:hypothetical protein ACWDA9_27570 [Streptomyces sp. NPDC001193]
MSTPDETLAPRAEAVRERYRATLGAVPAGVEARLDLALTHGRLHTEEAVSELRHIVLTDNALGGRVQQLVHFGQLLALGRADPARIHARGALHAGAAVLGAPPHRGRIADLSAPWCAMKACPRSTKTSRRRSAPPPPRCWPSSSACTRPWTCCTTTRGGTPSAAS